MKVYLLGQSGSGKSTLGKGLSEKLNCKFIELDSLWFEVNRDREVFTKRTLDILDQNDNWIIDGKYKSVRENIIDQSDRVILFKVPLYKLVYRNILRELKVNKKISLNFLKHLKKVISEYSLIEDQFKSQLSDYKEKVCIIRTFEDSNNMIENPTKYLNS